MSFGSAASVVGGIMQSIAASKEQKDMFKAYQDELSKQGGYQSQAQPIFDTSVIGSGSGEAANQMQIGQNNRMQSYNDIQNIPLSVTGTGESKDYLNRDSAQYQLAGKNRAALGSYGDWQNSLSNLNSNVGRGMGTIEQAAQGQAQNVFPYQMYAAQHSMDELNFWGQLISSIGGSAGNWANSFGGGSPPGGVGGQPGLAPSYQSALQDPSMFQQGFQTPYGQVPTGWQNIGGAGEGTIVPG